MRLLVDKDIAAADSAFEAYGEVELFDGRRLDRSRLSDAEALLVRSVTRVDRALLDGSAIRYVGSATAGIDHVAVDELDQDGVVFFNAPGCNANAVAEYVISAVLAFCVDRERLPDELSVGIIGCGAVGSRVAQKVAALGARRILNDPPLAASGARGNFDSLDAALACDVVTLHTPLVEDGPHLTRGLIGATQIAALRSPGLLINMARGGIVDEAALTGRLARDPEFRAVIDCWIGEPEVDADLLRGALLGTPHIAGHTVEARLAATRALCDRLDRELGKRNGWLYKAGVASQGQILDVAGNDPPLRRLAAAVASASRQREADQLLREAVARGAGRAQFDALRVRFATRREFSHYRVDSDAFDATNGRQLAALGFEMS